MKRLHRTLVVAALLALAAGFIPLHALEVRQSGGEGRVVFLTRVAPGDTFTLSFVHSVEKSEVPIISGLTMTTGLFYIRQNSAP